MRCSEARRRISRALDDELDSRDAAALAEHLAGCAECARFKADQARINAALAAMPIPEATEQDALRMAARVRGAVEAAPELARVSWVFRASALAAMLLLAAGVVFLSIQLRDARTQIAASAPGLPPATRTGTLN